VWQAVVKRGDAIWVVPALVAVVATVAWIVIGWQFMVIVNAAIGGGGGVATVTPAQVAAGAIPPATTTPSAIGTLLPSLPAPLRSILLGLGLLVFIFAWIITRRIMVLRTLKHLINRVVCPGCEFCLIGLKARGAIVICPECGERIDLFQNGFTTDDLLTETQKRRPFTGAGINGAYRVQEVVRSAKKAARPSGRGK